MSLTCAVACLTAATLVLTPRALGGFEAELSELRQCVKASGNPRKQCVSDFSDQVVDALKRSRGNDTIVTHSSINELIQMASEDAVLATMQGCASTAPVCLSDMTTAKMGITGLNASDITSWALCLEAETAMARKIAASMQMCMENVTAADVREACMTDATTVVPLIMQAGNLCRERDGDTRWKPSLFREAAVLAAKDACAACGSAVECDEEVAEAVGRALGKGTENLVADEAARFQNLAVIRAATDSVLGCLAARRDSLSATCDDPTSFLWSCGKATPADAVRAKTEEAKFRAQAAADGAARDKRGCFRTESVSEQTACFSASSAATRSLIDELVYVPGVSRERLDDRAEQLGRKATKLALGDEFRVCNTEATSSDAIKFCGVQLKVALVAAGLEGDVGDLMQQYRAHVLQGAASDCGLADPKECRMKARSEAEVSGMEVREYGVVRKLAAMRAAAEDWAACTEAGGGATCREFALRLFSTVSGVNISYVASKTMSQVENLAEALIQGLRVDLIRRKRLQVAVRAENNTCIDVFESDVAAKCEEAALSSGTRGNATTRPCRLVEELAEYGVYFAVDLEDAEMVTLSEAVATWLIGKTLIEPGSLLSFNLVLQAYASQDLAECAQGDLACQNDTVGDPPPTPAPPDASTNLAAGSFLAVPLLAAAVLLQLSVVEL